MSAAGEPGPRAAGIASLAPPQLAERVRSPRAALRALARFAREPAARPADAPADRALWGAAQVVHAAGLVFGDARLARAAAWPTLVTASLCVALAAWKAWRRDPLEDPTALHAFVVAFVALSSMPPTLLYRQWMRVGREARRAVGAGPGEEDPGGRYLAIVARETVKALRQALVVAAGLAPVLALVELTPLGRAWSAAAAALWAGYWIALDALELPMELEPGRLGPGAPTWFERGLRRLARRRLRGLRRVLAWPFQRVLGLGARWGGLLARPWRHEAKFTQRHPWETLGFALAAGVFLALPGVGLFFRAVALTAASALLARCGGPRSATRQAVTARRGPPAPARGAPPA